MKKIVTKLLYFYFKIPFWISDRLSNYRTKIHFKEEALVAACVNAEKFGNDYVSYRLRNKYLNKKDVIMPDQSEVGIILQGPICLEDNFTLNTIRLYKKQYPNADIVVSTWDDEDKISCKLLEDEGAVVLTTHKPENCGRLNINLQLITTRTGLDYFEKRKVKYVCKTRTDQRIYKENIFDFFISLLKNFPSINENGFDQLERIICLSSEYGGLFFPYYISDFLYFGRIEDLHRLFFFELDGRSKGNLNKNVAIREVVDNMLSPEVQIMKNYIINSNQIPQTSIKDYWRFIREHLICFNKDEIGIYWPKYKERYQENIRNGYYDPNSTKIFFQNLDFKVWYLLYTKSISYNSDYEKYLDNLV